MAMAENHTSHSQRMEQMEIEALIALDKGELARSNSGLLAGFIVAMSFGIASVCLIASGHDIPGTIFGTVDIVALASVFVIGRVYSNRKENDKRLTKNLAPPPGRVQRHQNKYLAKLPECLPNFLIGFLPQPLSFYHLHRRPARQRLATRLEFVQAACGKLR